MAYTAAEGRQQLLDDLARAIESLNMALAALGAAYEALDERSADHLEAQLFQPVQSAVGRARRVHSTFAARYGLPGATFPPASAGPPSLGARGFVDRAVDAVAEADEALAELQDSMLPVEVGDPELRAGLAEVRALVGDVSGRARGFLRTLGR
jgi:class 3 adenylate cyclase